MGKHPEHERRGPNRDKLIPPEHDAGMKLIHWLSPVLKDPESYKIDLTYDGHVARVTKIIGGPGKKKHEEAPGSPKFITKIQIDAAWACFQFLFPVLDEHPKIGTIVMRAMPNIHEIRKKLMKEKHR